jgi:hypothetical protein
MSLLVWMDDEKLRDLPYLIRKKWLNQLDIVIINNYFLTKSRLRIAIRFWIYPFAVFYSFRNFWIETLKIDVFMGQQRFSG